MELFDGRNECLVETEKERWLGYVCDGCVVVVCGLTVFGCQVVFVVCECMTGVLTRVMSVQ